MPEFQKSSKTLSVTSDRLYYYNLIMMNKLTENNQYSKSDTPKSCPCSSHHMCGFYPNNTFFPFDFDDNHRDINARIIPHLNNYTLNCQSNISIINEQNLKIQQNMLSINSPESRRNQIFYYNLPKVIKNENINPINNQAQNFIYQLKPEELNEININEVKNEINITNALNYLKPNNYNENSNTIIKQENAKYYIDDNNNYVNTFNQSNSLKYNDNNGYLTEQNYYNTHKIKSEIQSTFNIKEDDSINVDQENCNFLHNVKKEINNTGCNENKFKNQIMETKTQSVKMEIEDGNANILKIKGNITKTVSPNINKEKENKRLKSIKKEKDQSMNKLSEKLYFNLIDNENSNNDIRRKKYSSSTGYKMKCRKTTIRKQLSKKEKGYINKPTSTITSCLSPTSFDNISSNSLISLDTSPKTNSNIIHNETIQNSTINEITIPNSTINKITIPNSNTNETTISNLPINKTQSFSEKTNNIISTSKLVKKQKNKGGNYRGNKRPNFPPSVTKILKDWLYNNAYPFPTNTEKNELCEKTGLDLTQINNWFINARRRYI